MWKAVRRDSRDATRLRTAAFPPGIVRNRSATPVPRARAPALPARDGGDGAPVSPHHRAVVPCVVAAPSAGHPVRVLAPSACGAASQRSANGRRRSVGPRLRPRHHRQQSSIENNKFRRFADFVRSPLLRHIYDTLSETKSILEEQSAREN